MTLRAPDFRCGARLRKSRSRHSAAPAELAAKSEDEIDPEALQMLTDEGGARGQRAGGGRQLPARDRLCRQLIRRGDGPSHARAASGTRLRDHPGHGLDRAGGGPRHRRGDPSLPARIRARVRRSVSPGGRRCRRGREARGGAVGSAQLRHDQVEVHGERRGWLRHGHRGGFGGGCPGDAGGVDARFGGCAVSGTVAAGGRVGAAGGA